MGCGEVTVGDEPTKTSRKEEPLTGVGAEARDPKMSLPVTYDRSNPQRGNCGGRISPIAATWTKFFAARSEGKSGLRTRYVIAGRETKKSMGHEMGSSCLPCGRE